MQTILKSDNAMSTVLPGKLLNINLTFANDNGTLIQWITAESKTGEILGELNLDRKHFSLPEGLVLPRGAKTELLDLGLVASKLRREISYRLGLKHRPQGSGRPLSLNIVTE